MSENYAILQNTLSALVIIPTYNESGNIVQITDAVLGLEYPFHILIIDDNSTDGKDQLIFDQQKKHHNRIHLIQRPGKMGLASAYQNGFDWALKHDYQYIFEMDADFSHNPDDLPRLLKACMNDGFDLAVGSRYIGGVRILNWPIGRLIMSYYASIYVKVITGMKVHDTTSGFKCYSRKVLETIKYNDISFKGYAFQIEMKFRTWRKDFKIKEIPIVFLNREVGVSKMSGGIFNEALWGVIWMRLKSFFS